MKEIELKFLEIDVAGMQSRLKQAGFVKEFESDSRAMLFSGPGVDPWDSTQKCLRIREINGTVFCTVKLPSESSAMSIREEIEYEVDDFERAVEAFTALGYIPAVTLNKHRIHYSHEFGHAEIDSIEGIPTFLELEAASPESMQQLCETLNIHIHNGHAGTIAEIYPELKSYDKK